MPISVVTQLASTLLHREAQQCYVSRVFGADWNPEAGFSSSVIHDWTSAEL